MPIARAIFQLDDPVFRGVLLRSLALSLACFAAIDAGVVLGVNHLLGLDSWLAWTVEIFGSVASSLLAFWLFLPAAVGIGTFYVDRIASAVERKFYPWLPPATSAPMLEQVWDGLAVATRVLSLSLLALVVALVVPGLGLVLGWVITAYATGRSLFVGVALRRMSRPMAESLYRRCRGVVLVQGAILALAAYVPIVNLLVPIIGTAAMVHILDMALNETQRSGR